MHIHGKLTTIHRVFKWEIKGWLRHTKVYKYALKREYYKAKVSWALHNKWKLDRTQN